MDITVIFLHYSKTSVHEYRSSCTFSERTQSYSKKINNPFSIFSILAFQKVPKSKKRVKLTPTNQKKPSQNGLLTVDEDSSEHEKLTVISSDQNHKQSSPLVLRSYTPKPKSSENNHFKASIPYIYHLMEQNERRCEQQEHNATIGQEWQILGRVIDRLFVVLFLIGTLLVFGFIFQQAPDLRLK